MMADYIQGNVAPLQKQVAELTEALRKANETIVEQAKEIERRKAITAAQNILLWWRAERLAEYKYRRQELIADLRAIGHQASEWAGMIGDLTGRDPRLPTREGDP